MGETQVIKTGGVSCKMYLMSPTALGKQYLSAVTVRADCQGTRYEVTVYIDKRCRVKIYVRGEAVYIYTSLRGKVCAHAYAYDNNA